MRVAFHYVAAMVLCSSSLQVQLGRDLPPQLRYLADSKEYKAAYKLGVEETRKELEERHPTLYMSGLQNGFLEHLDKETGLPHRVIAGCRIEFEDLAHAEGHDETIRAHIKIHGLPKSSFKQWEKELFELQKYYVARTKVEKSVSLTIGGPKRVSPDGTFSITPVQIPREMDDGTIRPVLEMQVSCEGRKPETKSILMSTEADFLWGPPGSRFIVIRERAAPTMELYMAFDLERAAWLRWECDLKKRN